MRIFFIIDETLFFLPSYLDGVIKGLKREEKIIGITPLVTPRQHPTIYQYIIKNLWRLKIAAIIRLLKEFLLIQIKKILFVLSLSKNPATVAQVVNKYRLPLVDTKNVNDQNYLKKLRKLNIDIIISSCSQIFKKELLNIPQMACLNRHSALLPSYGGLFPVFQAMIHQEKEIGASVHKMTEKIDGGEVISQKVIPVKENDTLFSLYQKAYHQSISATLEAIRLVKVGKKGKILRSKKASYYRFPSDKDWQRFFSLKKKFI